MTTLEDLMAAGVPDEGKPRRLRLKLTAMAIATAAITAAGSIAVAESGVAQLVAGRRYDSRAALQGAAHPHLEP